MNPTIGFLTMSAAVFGAGTPSLDDAGLRAVLAQRLQGDRTGACFAAAIVDERVARAVVCADAKDQRGIDAHTAFEIGSVSKTMTAALAAELIKEGKLSLDDPLAKYLPDGIEAPEFEGTPILLRHLTTHTSGLPALPARMKPARADDPYASLTTEQLYGSLADVRLSAAPGTRFAYSNYAMMLYSDIIARRAGKPFDTLIKERLFEPLSMRDSHLGDPPKGVRAAVGHLQTGARTSAWHLPTNVAGVGGVRSSLDDMVHYVEAQLGKRHSALDPAIEMSQRELADVRGTRIAMNWLLSGKEGATVHAHEGGTGGFSSLVMFDRSRGRGVVILSDTALTATGGLGRLGLHLLDGSVPVEPPRRIARPDAKLLEALSGDYRLDGGLAMNLRRKGETLVIQAAGQSAYTMGYDSAGDFYPLDFDALLRPERQGDGNYRFTWLQGGGAMTATRVAAPGAGAAGMTKNIELGDAQRREYVGVYPLTPTFSLTVTDDDGVLYVQGTGQQRIAVEAVEKDVVVAAVVGAEIHFERDAAGKVIALELRQAGQKLRGVRQ